MGAMTRTSIVRNMTAIATPSGRNAANIMTTPPMTHTGPLKRWVAFQFSSLDSVQLTRMPTVLFWRHLGR